MNDTMATFELTTHPLAFAHMEGGVKTVYVMPWTPDLSGLCSGDRIEFDDLGSIAIGTVKRYPTLPELLTAEGYSNVVPEADDVDHAMTLLRASSGWNAMCEARDGVLAFRVRWAKRKS
jgi:ASC-1-like (ASCH) protein